MSKMLQKGLFYASTIQITVFVLLPYTIKNIEYLLNLLKKYLPHLSK